MTYNLDKTDLAVMQKRIVNALQDKDIEKVVRADFAHVFKQAGVTIVEANHLTDYLVQNLLKKIPLSEIEIENYHYLKDFVLENRMVVGDAIQSKLSDRAYLVYTQVKDHLIDVKGKIIDYGIGNGEISQFLKDNHQLDIEGVDIHKYLSSHVNVPMELITDHVSVPDKYYEAGMLLMVAHHEKDNEKIFKELDRIVQRKLVVIETVPDPKSPLGIEKDFERTFMNDYFYNRILYKEDIPVPGTFERIEDWPKRFSPYEWECTYSEYLGYDHPTINDVHQLYIFER